MSVPGINASCFQDNGPDATLEIFSSIFYSSHHERIFKQFDPRIHGVPRSSTEEKS
jgi:hypothetical protein